MEGELLIYFVLVGAVFLCSSANLEAAESIELKYASMNPAAAWIQDHSYLPFAEKVKTATNGRVTVRIHPQQTLGKATDFLNMVKIGIADMALGVQSFNPGQFPLTEMMDLPFLPVPTGEAGGLVRWELFEKFPEIKKEYAGIRLLHMASTDPYFIVTTQKPIRRLEDMKGLKLRVPGGRPADALKLMGAVPVLIPMPELYMALDKGVARRSAYTG